MLDENSDGWIRSEWFSYACELTNSTLKSHLVPNKTTPNRSNLTSPAKQQLSLSTQSPPVVIFTITFFDALHVDRVVAGHLHAVALLVLVDDDADDLVLVRGVHQGDGAGTGRPRALATPRGRRRRSARRTVHIVSSPARERLGMVQNCQCFMDLVESTNIE